MSKAKQQKRRELKREYALGKKHCVIRHGILGWGIPTFILYLIIMIVINVLFYKASFGEAVATLFPINIVLGVVIFSISGYFVGNARWKQIIKDLGKAPQSSKKANK